LGKKTGPSGGRAGGRRRNRGQRTFHHRGGIKDVSKELGNPVFGRFRCRRPIPQVAPERRDTFHEREKPVRPAPQQTQQTVEDERVRPRGKHQPGPPSPGNPLGPPPGRGLLAGVFLKTKPQSRGGGAGGRKMVWVERVGAGRPRLTEPRGNWPARDKRERLQQGGWAGVSGTEAPGSGGGNKTQGGGAQFFYR